MTLFSERSELPWTGPVPEAIEAGSPASAYAFLFALLCDPHDEILAPSPGCMPDALAHLWGVHLSRYPLVSERDRWSYEVAAIYDAIGERTRAIVIQSPCEPVGAMLDRDGLEALAALDLPIIADESSGHVLLDSFPGHGAGRAPSALDGPAPTLTFTIDAEGRITIGGPEDDASEARARLAAIASAHGAARALGSPVDAARCRANLARLRAIEGVPALPQVEGGTRIALRMPATRTDEAWARLLAERAVAAEPGSRVGLEGPWIVLSLDAPEERVAEQARVLADVARPCPVRLVPSSKE